MKIVAEYWEFMAMYSSEVNRLVKKNHGNVIKTDLWKILLREHALQQGAIDGVLML